MGLYIKIPTTMFLLVLVINLAGCATKSIPTITKPVSFFNPSKNSEGKSEPQTILKPGSKIDVSWDRVKKVAYYTLCQYSPTGSSICSLPLFSNSVQWKVADKGTPGVSTLSDGTRGKAINLEELKGYIILQVWATFGGGKEIPLKPATYICQGDAEYQCLD